MIDYFLIVQVQSKIRQKRIIKHDDPLIFAQN